MFCHHEIGLDKYGNKSCYLCGRVFSHCRYKPGHTNCRHCHKYQPELNLDCIACGKRMGFTTEELKEELGLE